MRVAFFVDGFPVVSETFILNQITGLIDRGHTVDIFARGRRHHANVHSAIHDYSLMEKTTYLDASGTRLQRIADAARLLASSVWLAPKGMRVLFNLVRHYGDSAPFNTLSVLRIASRDLQDGPYDVIHCQYGTLGRALVRFRDRGLIHGRLVTSFRGHDITQSDKLNEGYYDELFLKADLLLPVSHDLEARLVALGAPVERTVVLHSGIDCSRFRFRERTRTAGMPLVIVTIARLVEMKGVAYGIEAIAMLIRSGVQLVYHVIGDGPLYNELRALTERLGIAACVQLHGAKSNDDVLLLLDSADVLLAPSVTAANGEAEGIPNAVKEAMATGLPVVATRHSGIPELVEHGVSGYLVPERDAAALAERLNYLNVHSELWRDMGSKGREKVEREFDMHSLNDTLVKLYTDPGYADRAAPNK